MKIFALLYLCTCLLAGCAGGGSAARPGQPSPPVKPTTSELSRDLLPHVVRAAASVTRADKKVGGMTVETMEVDKPVVRTELASASRDLEQAKVGVKDVEVSVAADVAREKAKDKQITDLQDTTNDWVVDWFNMAGIGLSGLAALAVTAAVLLALFTQGVASRFLLLLLALAGISAALAVCAFAVATWWDDLMLAGLVCMGVLAGTLVVAGGWMGWRWYRAHVATVETVATVDVWKAAGKLVMDPMAKELANITQLKSTQQTIAAIRDK